jgi:hypothetical protein
LGVVSEETNGADGNRHPHDPAFAQPRCAPGRTCRAARQLVAALIVGATHHGAGTMAAGGMAVEEAAAVTESFLASALRGLRLDRV